ncbi:hypothetical protein [Paenibacillus amylolyticus]|uniref:hypothetical protein n=1 Tax=Paenibacillus amylolyticus TaxID=1451 RepID=UPI0019621876|nr:hypothetical protein [Paenibacillus amylolyticus]
MNKRDIQTVPAFLWEGGDGLLSLKPNLPQTSTVVPFESNVTRGMQKRSGEKETGETELKAFRRKADIVSICYAFTTGFHP